MSRRRFVSGAVSAIGASLAGCTSPVINHQLSVRDPPRPETESSDSLNCDAPFTQETKDAAQVVGRTVRESVVLLQRKTNHGKMAATGWFYDSETVVTNAHVADAGESFTCWTADGSSFEGRPVGSIHGKYDGVGHVDVGVLEVEGTGPSLDHGSSKRLGAERPLLQVGNPGLVGNWVISLGRYIGQDPFYGFTSTVPTRSGNSGSPVVTLDGNVVGVTSGQTSRGVQPGVRDGEPAPADVGLQTSFNEEVMAIHTPIETVAAFVEEAAQTTR